MGSAALPSAYLKSAIAMLMGRVRVVLTMYCLWATGLLSFCSFPLISFLGQHTEGARAHIRPRASATSLVIGFLDGLGSSASSLLLYSFAFSF